MVGLAAVVAVVIVLAVVVIFVEEMIFKIISVITLHNFKLNDNSIITTINLLLLLLFSNSYKPNLK